MLWCGYAAIWIRSDVWVIPTGYAPMGIRFDVGYLRCGYALMALRFNVVTHFCRYAPSWVPLNGMWVRSDVGVLGWRYASMWVCSDMDTFRRGYAPM